MGGQLENFKDNASGLGAQPRRREVRFGCSLVRAHPRVLDKLANHLHPGHEGRLKLKGKVVSDPLAIQLAPELWALMGISSASLVGSPLVLSTKMRKNPADPEKQKEAAGRHFGETADEVEENREGTLYGNSDIRDARFTDLFEGEELKNAAHIDLARVQMFLFTVVAAVVYAAALYNVMGLNPGKMNSFPELSPGLLVLLGISHASYLGSKAVDHTRVAE